MRPVHRPAPPVLSAPAAVRCWAASRRASVARRLGISCDPGMAPHPQGRRRARCGQWRPPAQPPGCWFVCGCGGAGWAYGLGGMSRRAAAAAAGTASPRDGDGEAQQHPPAERARWTAMTCSRRRWRCWVWRTPTSASMATSTTATPAARQLPEDPGAIPRRRRGEFCGGLLHKMRSGCGKS